MSSYVDELVQELEVRGSAVRVDDLLRTLRAVAQTLEELGRHRDTLVETVQFVNQLQERLMIVDDLPDEAPLGALIRRRNGTVLERATVYTGNGPGQPLAKLVPVAL